jgi:tetratricopeptide (TPR) repeat protein
VLRLFRFVLLLFLGSALLLTMRLAVAEAQFRRDPQPAPHSLNWLRAEKLVRYNSSPEELQAAVSLNPRLSPAWIYLGLDAETHGNLAEAEADLLRAARVDRQYLPAWTLANFYFRRGDRANFWPWAQRAAALTSDDYRPLLRLADALETSPQGVATRLVGDPPLAPLLRAYLDLLIGAGRFDSAQEVARLLAAWHDPSDRARLADFADRQRRAGTSEVSH